jgi:ATP-dependent Lhr-like helicase
VQVEEALGELVARGLVTADSFHGLRALLTPQSRRRGFRGRGRLRGSTGFDAAGRWALLELPPEGSAPPDAIEHAAKALLRRYGVMCRKLLAREALAPTWRELLPFYRSAEARGEIRGGRFVEPLGGEQFALIEAVEELRRLRRAKDKDEWVTLSVADPLNLAGLPDDAPRVAAETAAGLSWLTALEPADQRRAAALLAPPDDRVSASRGRGYTRWASFRGEEQQ